MTDDDWEPPSVLLTVDLVILTLRGTSLQLLLVERGVEPHAGTMALPGGFLRDADEPILVAARRELSEEAGLDADSLLLEQFGVYGNPGRDPRGRVVSVAFLAIAPRLPDPWPARMRRTRAGRRPMRCYPHRCRSPSTTSTLSRTG